MIGRRLVIRGRVQGVGYRDAMIRSAVAQGVAGWVRNHRDGHVEAHVQGEPPAVEAVIAWCRQGPRAARVTAVDVTEAPHEPATGFRLLPSA
jgi:acylphosphatase